ncbi:hypothetical protein COLO4_36387 [Corchorus olitorius]|uniref:Uncharacterized protein n=1 Tax=Corchorus olitorius TaxID=93759 RepID=A0A1R3G941_9ROSI|nr:hypothetical protein COLO4_36387 [Corchorus olitorius]
MLLQSPSPLARIEFPFFSLQTPAMLLVELSRTIGMAMGAYVASGTVLRANWNQSEVANKVSSLCRADVANEVMLRLVQGQSKFDSSMAVRESDHNARCHVNTMMLYAC